MQVQRWVRPFVYALGTIFLVLAPTTVRGRAQNHDDHLGSVIPQFHKPSRDENALVRAVREATARFKDVTTVDGPHQGYELMFGCVSGGEFGAMGLHYVNMSLVDGEVDVNKPEIVLFEPAANGRIRITGADYLVPAEAWHATHKAPPELMGQLFHLFESPNRFGLPAFYTLHVWAWKGNRHGTFVNWNPEVSCDGFNSGRMW